METMIAISALRGCNNYPKEILQFSENVPHGRDTMVVQDAKVVKENH